MENRYVNLDWRPEVERPILISAFSGWNDAGEAASLALGTLESEWEAKRFGSFDPEEFFDFQATRPQIKLVEGVTREIEWPENIFSVAPEVETGSGGRGVILLSGPEPNFRWRSFSEAVVEVARELDASMVITLGALLADVPHSRPVSVSANVQEPSLVEGIDLAPSRYEGPTGVTGVLHGLCAEAGIPSVSFWASTPHYLPAVPSAPAALALLEKLASLAGLPEITGELEKTAEDYREQISAAVLRDSDLSSYVQMLEERYDSQVEEGDEERGIPSGDELAQELEDFLRNQRDDE